MTLGPLMIDIEGLSLSPEDKDLLKHPQVGGIIIFSRNYADRDQLRALTDEIRALRSPPLLIAVDQEGGRVQRLRHQFTELPPLHWLGHLHDADPSQARSMAITLARVMAQEVLDCGVDFSFAPVLDIHRGLCDVIGDRAIHKDPEVVAALGLAYMQGMRQVGMQAVAKHFPGHGGVTGDSHHVLPEDHRAYIDLQDDIRPYTTLIADGLAGVMLAHIRFTEVEPQIASLSDFWIRRVLRGELGFRGAIFSDDLTMEGACAGGDIPERTLTALNAGADMALICNNRPAVAPVLEALEGFDQPAAHGRLAAMRANPARYAAAPHGSSDWRKSVDRLHAALERPPLVLDGGS